MHNGIYLVFMIATVLPQTVFSSDYNGVERIRCKNFEGSPIRPHSEYRHRLHALRAAMKSQIAIGGSEIDAYIVTSFDEHQNEDVADCDKRREYITGFTGTSADAVVTIKSAALWTDERYIAQADAELDCDWKIFSSNESPSIPEWIASQLPTESLVGADPYSIPHFLWDELDLELHQKFIRLIKVHRNLIDDIWKRGRPNPNPYPVRVQELAYAGENWLSKIGTIRSHLIAAQCDAIIVTSLTEIAYTLNLRGEDLPYTPVFKAYLIVTINEIYLYTNKTKIGMGITLHLKDDPCRHENCVRIKEYSMVWHDIRTFAQRWRKVMIPNRFAFDMGASEAIFSALPRYLIDARVSPIIFMRAQKNEVEREGMRRAHILDGAAMCETLSYIEQRFNAGDSFTEMSVALEADRSRRKQLTNHGLSLKTVVAYGQHSSMSHYETHNQTNIKISDDSTLIIDSGGQYSYGTTKVTRTIHLGSPTHEQRTAYTNVLRGIIQLSTLNFPDNLRPADVDALSRGPLWGTHNDYPHSTGHGIGAFLSVHESPINVAYSTTQNDTFKDGYFFTNEPGYYKPGDFGIRIENVLEVIETEKRQSTGHKFLAFNDVTLVPYDSKLIDKSMLSTLEKKWLNKYNAKIRDYVGDELKKQLTMQAFYWMMNKTRHIVEYNSEAEFRNRHNNANRPIYLNNFLILMLTLIILINIKK